MADIENTPPRNAVTRSSTNLPSQRESDIHSIINASSQRDRETALEEHIDSELQQLRMHRLEESVSQLSFSEQQEEHSLLEPHLPASDQSKKQRRSADLHLLAIPGELRNEIYDLVFPETFDAEHDMDLVHAAKIMPSKALILTCRQIYREAGELRKTSYRRFWKTHTFVINAIPVYRSVHTDVWPAIPAHHSLADIWPIIHEVGQHLTRLKLHYEWPRAGSSRESTNLIISDCLNTTVQPGQQRK